ncbi:MAG: cytochrome c maturation protein CcmE [Peptococcaceae bacterium]|nr:cytochrome c maturation protein CcmE [Peptococcaceae bacterium]
MKSKNIKIAAGIIVIVAAIAYLIISSMGSTTAAYYMKVSEALNGNHDPNTYYRIEGKIDVDHAQFNGASNPVVLTFDMYSEKDANQKLHVVYNDVKPDNFKDATDAVIEGNFTSNDTFHAKTLMLKCPSKYQPAAAQPAQDEGPVTKLLKAIGLKS